MDPESATSFSPHTLEPTALPARFEGEAGAGPTANGAQAFLITGRQANDLLRAMQAADNSNTRRPTRELLKVTLYWQAHENGGSEVAVPLSPRELSVVRGLADGLSYKLIAAELGIGYETVRSHIRKLYAKLGVRSNTEAVAKALRTGSLDDRHGVVPR